MSKKYIPSHHLNTPHGGQQIKISVPSDAEIYSVYTSNLVNIGPIPWGTLCDAPPGNPNYGKNYHVIQFNPANNSWMVHNPNFGRQH